MANIVLYNGTVLTMDDRRPVVQMVAIKDNRILAVGDSKEVGKFAGPGTRLIDCEGKTVIPGFNDAHCHPISFAMTLLHVDCSPSVVKSIGGIQAQLRQQAERLGQFRWIRAARYNEASLAEGRHPTRWELDEAAPNNPVMLVHDSGKICVLNTMALSMVGITRDTPDPPGGHIGRDELSREPNGLIVGRNEQVERGVPPIEKEELRRGVDLANQEYLSRGITSVQDTTWTNGLHHWRYYKELKGLGALAPRVTMLVGSDNVEEVSSEGLRTGVGDDQLRVGGVKIALDESEGCSHPSQEELNRHALQAHMAGFQLCFHVSDVYNLQASLGALQFLVRKDSRPYVRPRLEHCSVCPPALVPKLKAYEVMVVTQPAFLYYLGDTYRRDVPAEERVWLYPLRSFKANGVMAAISSDSPLFSCTPFIGIYAASYRRDHEGQDIAPQERISLLDALKWYTFWPAYASLEEELKGSITPGKLADVVVLSKDPTRAEPEEVMGIDVVMTIINGEIVWEK